MGTIATSQHPDYTAQQENWLKFRYTMEGGDAYVEQYMVKFSGREEEDDFRDRKTISPIPGFASAALVDVKNAIFQRMEDIKRIDSSGTYGQVVSGLLDGIDLQQSTMNHFIGRSVLPELIFLGKVGIYLDMPTFDSGATRAETNNLHPYAYTYKAEQIKNWVYTPNQEGRQYDKLLLEEQHPATDQYGLPDGVETRFRFLERENGIVKVTYFNVDGQQIDSDGELTDDFIILQRDTIPFIPLELEASMLQDIANHQIALLNMESADVAYTLKANYPFYTEQNSGRFGSTHLKGSEDSDEVDGSDVDLGAVQGRLYTKGLDRPGFIHPSSEPLKASMEKQKNLKDDIRALVNLALSAIRPKFSSAESKQYDERGLESGLSFLGLILEQAERQLAVYYSEYENAKPASVHYPERYSLKTDKQTLDDAAQYAERMPTVPSKTYQKAIATEISTTLLSSKVSPEDLAKIHEEIEAAEWMSSDAKEIHGDLEKGLVTEGTASRARGYAPGEVAKARIEHAARIERIKAAQTPDNAGARGVADESADSGDGAVAEKDESQNADMQDDAKKAVRGEADS